MKKLYFVLFALLLTHFAIAQCNLNVSLNQTNAYVCSGSNLTFLGYASTDCAGPYIIAYNWDVTVADATGATVDMPELNLSGNATTLTTIPNYYFDINSGLTLTSICFTVSLLDQNLATVSAGTICGDGNYYPQPIVVSVLLGNNMCGNPNCINNILVSGGSPPYIYDLGNGELWNPNTFNCIEVPGVYQVTVTDMNGCTGTTTMLIPEDNSNSLCANAVPLENGVVLEDVICGFDQGSPMCGAPNYYQSGWYVVNSGDFAHLHLSLSSSLTPGTIYQSTYMEVYEEGPGQDCSTATMVYCTYGFTDFGCFDLSQEIAMQPNTNYFIRALSMWTTAAPIEILAVLTNDVINPICGCNDPGSCNFDPDALISDNSCGYNGCTDPGACNYLSYASCDDGSCIFGSDLTGQAFHDLNGDGIWSSYPVSEPSLGNIGFVYIQELDITVYPDGNGQFVLPDLSPGVYHVSFNDPTGAWSLSVISPIAMTLPTCNGLLLPLVPVSGAAAQISGTGSFWSPTLHCSNGMNQGIYVQNTGNVPLNGTFALTIDPSLTYSGYPWGPTVDSFVNGVLTWNIVNQAPGTTVYYMAHINGPGAAMVGNSFPFEFSLSLADDNFFTFYEETWTNNALVSCAYDPNDKTAVPVGYTENHYILADDEIQYTIRFQNTGNAPAFNVRIEDQIDIAHLDMSTFEPVVASHSFSTIAHPDGLVEFVFNQIMLPDSGMDEPGSQGFVVYRITPKVDIELETVIENTASIYFDENPAIVTNTTHHAIYSCSMIQNLATEDEVCAGLPYVYELNDSNIETYDWFVNGELTSNENYVVYDSDIAGDVNITLIRSNPLCTVEQNLVLHNHPVPGTDIVVNGGTLTAPAGTSWSWYLNDALIPDAITQTFVPLVDGMYTVNTVNEFGCVITSEDVFFVGVDTYSIPEISLFPNPMVFQSRLVLPSGKNQVCVINSIGEIVLNYHDVVSSLTLEKSNLPSGSYVVRVSENSGQIVNLKLLVN